MSLYEIFPALIPIRADIDAAIACIIRLPIAVASSGPAATGMPHASAVIWLRKPSFVPPPIR